MLLERKRSEEYLEFFCPVGCRKKLWGLLLPQVHLEKQQLRQKSERFYSWLAFLETSLSIHIFLNKHCCPCKWFSELLFFLSWLFVKICFLSLFRLLFCACIKWIWRLEVKCTGNDYKTSSYWCSFKQWTAWTGSLSSAWQKSEVKKADGWFWKLY